MKMDEQTKPLRKIAGVRLDTSGVRKVGPYEAGKVYPVGDELSLAEAHRLVDAKGFTELTRADLTAPKQEG